MNYLPSTPDIGGANLAAYLGAIPTAWRYYIISAPALALPGSVGDHARYYIVSRHQRREVFRGILRATHQRIPLWAKDCLASVVENRDFMTHDREAYHASRNENRSRVG
ncbi:hypothetical protein A6F68_02658 [Tsuneonella dongtanensis]|uniref:Uncharacterized protein n=1 Tax=Tsuneonella dongtanensis TaxID=692370 RepID=A0A1B2AG83_9SPHN|nr:hypothetical protein [Tsuneonella dongtanensis]ANY21152.1 hypothetical protein A6F68_02658 [Tsuneonella dongtanensis]